MRAAELPREPPSVTLPSAAGATRRASRTITNAIPPRSTIATAEPASSSELEVEVLLDVLAAVVEVCGVVVSPLSPSLVSSLNELPLPRFADQAACGTVDNDPTASAAHTASSDARRLRDKVSNRRLATARGYRRRMRPYAGRLVRARQTLE
jgi:hypothetical protein